MDDFYTFFYISQAFLRTDLTVLSLHVKRIIPITMHKPFMIVNALIVNEGNIFRGSVRVEEGKIKQIETNAVDFTAQMIEGYTIIDAEGKYLLPGVIDSHVHFREPGLTHKADISTETHAAVAGGVTSFMEMPNTIPQATTLALLEDKYRLASGNSLANYSFFLGASNDNIREIVQADPQKICGVKIFFGASTGNMLVDKLSVLEEIFRLSPLPVAAHCEDESVIRANSDAMRNTYGEDVPVELHPLIRSADACYRSSELAVSLARKYGTRLHITHISTSKELSLMQGRVPLAQKRITTEACTHYLWFCDEDYARLGMKIKVNPAIKSAEDRAALLQGLCDGHIDIISSDHAPHLLSEKAQSYFKAPSGAPIVQHSLPAMIELWKRQNLKLEVLVDKMCHAPATCYQVKQRGFIREGYFADLVLVAMDDEWKVSPSNIFSKCGWSPWEGHMFKSRVTHTFVNGNLVYENGHFDETSRGQRLMFDR
jgi:dihydroorotase